LPSFFDTLGVQENIMRALILKLWAVLPTILLIQAIPSLAQTVCDAAEVKLDNNHIQIAPNGVDDTDNIQCALDLAVEQRIPEIRLIRGDFFIGALVARGFHGTLQGGGQEHTRIRVLAQSVDCAASETRGETTAIIKFIGGEPRLRWLTLITDPNVWACAQGEYIGLGAMVHFTGRQGAAPDCPADVVYGTIDRVTLEGPRNYDMTPQTIRTGLLTEAEGAGSPDCRGNLLGSVKINRSRIGGFSTGASLEMRGNAQISVFSSDFDGNHTGLRLADSNAVVTLFGNRFASSAPGSYDCCRGGGTGIAVDNRVDSTGATRLDVRGNTFNVTSGGNDYAWGLRLNGASGATAVNVVISNNRFDLSGGGDMAMAVSSLGVSGGLLSDNLTVGYLGGGLFFTLNAEQLGDADHWTVVANSGLAEMYGPYPDYYDIYLGANSSNTLIGPGQAAMVRDEGVDNITLLQ